MFKAKIALLLGELLSPRFSLFYKAFKVALGQAQ